MTTETNLPNVLQTVDAASFEALVRNGEGPIVVEFMSYGCAHCRALEPVIQEVAKTLSSRETIYRVNVAVDQDLAAEYSIEGTPTLVMFLDGREIGRVAGPQPTVESIMSAVTEPFNT